MASREAIEMARAVFARIAAEHKHAWEAVYRTAARGLVRVPLRRCACGEVQPIERTERALRRDDDLLRTASALHERGELALVLGDDVPRETITALAAPTRSGKSSVADAPPVRAQ